MPSFIVHSIAGEKIMEYLKLNGEAKNKFFIANLLPDAKENIPKLLYL